MFVQCTWTIERALFSLLRYLSVSSSTSSTPSSRCPFFDKKDCEVIFCARFPKIILSLQHGCQNLCIQLLSHQPLDMTISFKKSCKTEVLMIFVILSYGTVSGLIFVIGFFGFCSSDCIMYLIAFYAWHLAATICGWCEVSSQTFAYGYTGGRCSLPGKKGRRQRRGGRYLYFLHAYCNFFLSFVFLPSYFILCL